MKQLNLSFNPTRIVIVALILMIVVAVMFGIDLINGRWDDPLIQPQPPL